jgi:hypothetical protein
MEKRMENRDRLFFSTVNKIPTDEDYARAKALMRERDRGMNSASENSLRYFKKICPKDRYNLHMIAEDDYKLRTYVFYKKSEDLQIYLDNGVSQQIIEFVYAELERQKRGKRDEIEVELEFDSHENVAANYDGNYFLRLR